MNRKIRFTATISILMNKYTLQPQIIFLLYFITFKAGFYLRVKEIMVNWRLGVIFYQLLPNLCYKIDIRSLNGHNFVYDWDTYVFNHYW